MDRHPENPERANAETRQRLNDDRPAWIVAEVSKNWKDGGDLPGAPFPGRAINSLFEEIILKNWHRGYVLHQFDLHRLLTGHGVMNETIVAVFRFDPALLAELAKPKPEAPKRPPTDANDVPL